ncbi:MAG: hypothetical protein II933_01455 [Candidatus Methanomethylophilaceae archaeon]|nr:hypothetical protein [Candidatus Methanomethylophilaceae archaeon]
MRDWILYVDTDLLRSPEPTCTVGFLTTDTALLTDSARGHPRTLESSSFPSTP